MNVLDNGHAVYEKAWGLREMGSGVISELKEVRFNKNTVFLIMFELTTKRLYGSL